MSFGKDYLLGNDLRLTALPSSGEPGLPAYMPTAIGAIPLEAPVNPKVTNSPKNGVWDAFAGAISTGVQTAANVGGYLWNEWLVDKVDGKTNKTTNNVTANQAAKAANASGGASFVDWIKQPMNMIKVGGGVLATIAAFALIKKVA